MRSAQGAGARLADDLDAVDIVVGVVRLGACLVRVDHRVLAPGAVPPVEGLAIAAVHAKPGVLLLVLVGAFRGHGVLGDLELAVHALELVVQGAPFLLERLQLDLQAVVLGGDLVDALRHLVLAGPVGLLEVVVLALPYQGARLPVLGLDLIPHVGAELLTRFGAIAVDRLDEAVYVGGCHRAKKAPESGSAVRGKGRTRQRKKSIRCPPGPSRVRCESGGLRLT